MRFVTPFSEELLSQLPLGMSAEKGNPVEYPAAYAAQIDGVMAVGAVGASGKRAYYSNTGPHVEIVAPGGTEREGQAAMIHQTAVCKTDYDSPQIS